MPARPSRARSRFTCVARDPRLSAGRRRIAGRSTSLHRWRLSSCSRVRAFVRVSRSIARGVRGQGGSASSWPHFGGPGRPCGCAPLGDEAVGSGARLHGNASATTVFSCPYWRAGINGSITRSRPSSASQQETTLRPKTPFPHSSRLAPSTGASNARLAQVRSAVGTLRFFPVCTSDVACMIGPPAFP
jgi:hypothetical protein